MGQVSKSKATDKSKKRKPAKGSSAEPGLFLESISFRKKYRVFNRSRKLAFRPGVNLMVGEQGSGKSTIIELLCSYCSQVKFKNEEARKTIKLEIGGNVPILNYDFEKDNVRTQGHLSESGAGIAFQLNSHFMSHGEVGTLILKGLENEIKEPTLVLLDEPDMALSPKNALLLAKQLQRLAAGGNQILAAVHNPLVIASQAEVFSLEHKRWMGSDKFLLAHAEAAEKG